MRNKTSRVLIFRRLFFCCAKKEPRRKNRTRETNPRGKTPAFSGGRETRTQTNARTRATHTRTYPPTRPDPPRPPPARKRSRSLHSKKDRSLFSRCARCVFPREQIATHRPTPNATTNVSRESGTPRPAARNTKQKTNPPPAAEHAVTRSARLKKDTDTKPKGPNETPSRATATPSSTTAGGRGGDGHSDVNPITLNKIAATPKTTPKT